MAYLSDIFKGNESGLHVGTLATFLKDKVPAGYLIPNGAEFSSLEYPELFTYLGSNKLPDLIDDESVPVGSIMPWASDSDIPDGWHHLGVRPDDIPAITQANAVGRNYNYSEYPEFCDYLGKQLGQNISGKNQTLWLLGSGEILRQRVIKNLHSVNTSWRDCDVTESWGFQGDAIRPVTGYNSYLYTSDLRTNGSGVFSWTVDTSGQLHPLEKKETELYSNARFDLNFDISRVHPVAKDVRMTNRSVNYLIKVKPSKITKTTIAIKAAGRVSDEGLMQVEGIRKELDTFSHANLLINGDFSVWQRGDTFTTLGETYVTDRWKFFGYGANWEVISTQASRAGNIQGFVQYNPEAANENLKYFGFKQKIELPLSLKKAIQQGGGKITFSNLTGSSFSIYKTNAPVTFHLAIDIQQDGVSVGKIRSEQWEAQPNGAFQAPINFTFDLKEVLAKLPDSGVQYKADTCLVAEFQGMNQGSSAEIYYYGGWKLELGSKATPFVPDDPVTNLAKCQRYFQYLDAEIMDFSPSASYGRPDCTFPVVMRAIPAVSAKQITGKVVATYARHSGCSWSMSDGSANSNGYFYMLSQISFDAEL